MTPSTINSEIVAAQLELIAKGPGAHARAADHLLRAWTGCMEVAAPRLRLVEAVDVGELALRVAKGEGLDPPDGKV